MESSSLNIQYKRSQNESYMVIEDQEFADSYEQQMIRENQLKALLSFFTIQLNGRVQIWYNITGKESLKDYIEGDGFTLEKLERLLIAIKMAYEETGKYLINQEHIYLSPETTYIDKGKSKELSLCYFPMRNGATAVQFQSVIELILVAINHEDKAFCRLCYEMYDLSLKGNYTFDELIEMATAFHEDEMDYERPEIFYDSEPVEQLQIEEIVVPEKKTIFSIIKDAIIKLREKILGKNSFGRRAKQRKPVIIEDFVIEPEEDYCEPTVLLSESTLKCVGKLIYDGDGEREDSYLIDREVFRIGSNPSKNDAVLRAKTISSVHARIIHKDQEYFLEDLNSTNGTFHNGKAMNYHEKIKLAPMDQILFADVAYLFM